MDAITGNIYATQESARRAGVSDEHIRPVYDGELIRVTSGPFKGRVYRKTATNIVRVLAQEHRTAAAC